MKRFVVSILFVCVSLTSFANDKSSSDAEGKRQLDRLFELMDADQMVDQMWLQMESVFAGMQQQLNISADEMVIFEKYNNQIIEVMRKELSWEKMAPEVAHIYKSNFTPTEIEAFIDFYGSPAGQAYVEMMPTITQESMMMGQNMVVAIMPEIQSITERLNEELATHREKSQ